MAPPWNVRSRADAVQMSDEKDMNTIQDLEFRTAEQRQEDGFAALGEAIRSARETVAFWASRLPDPGHDPLKPDALASMPTRLSYPSKRHQTAPVIVW